MRRILVLACTCLGLLIAALGTVAKAADFPDAYSDTVNDFAGLLDQAQTVALDQLLQEARRETGVHIVVTTIERQSDYNDSRRFPDFATAWFNHWGIGDAERDDGILLFVSHGDREMRLVLGEGYDVPWDGTAQRVVDRFMLPEFAQDNYAAGLHAGAEAAVTYLARPFSSAQSPPDLSDPIVWEEYVFGAFFLGILGLILKNTFFERVKSRFTRCGHCGRFGLRLQRREQTPALETTAGLRKVLHHCTHCHNEAFVRDEHIPSLQDQRASAQSDNDSGYGGGSSSGGGASGRW